MPLATFRLQVAAMVVVLALLAGLLAWLAVGLLLSLHPDAWRVSRASARRLWRRDAAAALVVSIAAGAALSVVNALLAARFHAYAPVRIDLFPGLFDAPWPGAGLFLDSLVRSFIYAPLAGVAILAVRAGWARRAWWLWLGAGLLVIALGPERAHSLPEFLAGWVMSFISLAVAVGLVVLFYRDNVLAYVGAAFCLPLVRPLVLLFSQPAAFFRWNGLLLAALMAIVLGWMFLAEDKSAAATLPPA